MSALNFRLLLLTASVFALSFGSTGSVQSQQEGTFDLRPQQGDIPSPSRERDLPIQQLIIKYHKGSEVEIAQAADKPEQIARLSARAGVELSYFRPMSGDAHVLRLARAVSVQEAERAAARLSELPEVEYAEPDYIWWPAQVTPNDPQYSQQWHYHSTYGIGLPQAWAITQGNFTPYVAVLDTGHLTHEDLNGRYVGGYDFISSPTSAGDGDGRDPDPSDPGDWAPPGLCSPSDPGDSQSSWHGIHVAGTIGALTNNGVGVAGVNWAAKMLSVRVLGKCGGTTSDIADAMRWAAGLPVSGVPNNPNPAKILNMSLGGFGPCPTAYQSAANDVTVAGAIVVVAAGNSNYNARVFRPANCDNVLTVGATNSSGVRASFSNYGERVDISAPGVNVLSTHNAGSQSPGADSYASFSGTSMAAPHVAGVVSLMAALRPSLTLHEARRILQQTAKPFAPGNTCLRTRSCGAGIVDAHAALRVLAAQPRAFLPVIRRQLGVGAWTDLLFEGFEGVFPVGGWSIFDDQNRGYHWGRRSCEGFNSSSSVWAIGGGSAGSGLSCTANYTDNLDTWLIVGPYDLSNATAASLTFRYKLNTESGYDFFFWGASDDFRRFVGQVVSGTTSGNWVQGSTGLTEFLGKSQVWIGFNFWTDFSVTYPMGVRVDDILLRRCMHGTCTTTLLLQDTPSKHGSADRAESLPSSDISAQPAVYVLGERPHIVTKPKP